MIEGIKTKESSENYNIQVAGFSSHITDFKQVMNDLSRFNSKCVIQLMDAEGIAGSEHAIHATIHAIKAFSRKENISKDIGLEICVRASGQRQISRAINILGIKNGDLNVCAVAVGCAEDVMSDIGNLIGKRDDNVLEADMDKLKSLYSLSDKEINTAGSVSKLLIERTSLLILEN
jgi:KEOPS complex subunit Cgi121